MSDLELLQRWASERDSEAFHELVRRHGGMVYGTCVRVLRNAADAEDVAQDCFLELLRHPGGVRSSLGAWLHRLAYHRSLDQRRKEQRRDKREDSYAAGQTPHTDIGWDDLAPLIDEAIDGLPRKQREVLIAYFIEQDTQEHIAERLGVNRRTVSNRIQQGVTRVRESLRRAGVVVSAATLTALAQNRIAEALPAEVAADIGRAALAITTGAAPAATAFWTLPKIAGAVAVVAVASVLVFVFPSEPESESQQLERAPVITETVIDAESTQSLGYISSEPETATASALPTQTAAATPDTRTAGIVGKVFDDSTFENLSGLEVVATRADDETQRWTTRSSGGGSFRFDDLPLGEYSVSFTPTEFLIHVRRKGSIPAQLTEAGSQVEVSIPVDSIAILRGVVTDQYRNPIPNARVYVRTRTGDHSEYKETDERGVFEFKLEPSGAFGLRAQAEGFTHIPDPPAPLPNRRVTEVAIAMSPEYIAQGTIVDSDGNPIKGERVMLKAQGFELAPNLFDSRPDSSEDGRFEVRGLHPGEYMYSVIQPRAHMLQGPVVIDGSERVVYFDVTYDPPPSIDCEVLVTDAGGSPVPGASVYGRIDGVVEGRLGNTNDSGHVRVQYTNETDRQPFVWAEKDGWSTAKHHPITPSDSRLTLVLYPSGPVEGIVLDANTNEPIESFEIVLGNEHDNEWQGFNSSDGRFRILDQPPGERSIRVRADGYSVSDPIQFRIPGTKPIEVALMPGWGQFTGRVLDPNGNPVEDAAIYIDEPAISSYQFRDLTKHWTDSDGLFTLESLSASEHTLYIYHESFATARVDLSAGVGQEETRDITLQRGGSVAARIVSPYLTIADPRIQVGDAHPALREARPDADGVLRLKALDPGVQRILFTGTVGEGDSARSIRRMVAANIQNGVTTELEFHFEPENSTLKGQVTVEGALLAGRIIILQYDTPGYVEDVRTAITDVNGMFIFEGVPAGPATVRVWSRAPTEVTTEQGDTYRNPWERFPGWPVVIREGEVTEVTLDIPNL